MENEMETTDQTNEPTADFLTPEDLAMYKELQARIKNQKKGDKQVKVNLFDDLSNKFGASIMTCKKDVVTISTGDKLEDDNIYTVTLGAVDEAENEVDPKELATSIVMESLATIQRLMGVGNSIKVSGEVDGKKLFWQIRKR